MAEELSNYKLQLEQVEVALLSDANNEELLKLKEDIEQLINLQRELIKTQESERRYVEPSSYDQGSSSTYHKEQKRNLKIWKVGDKCMARDSKY
jgi:survival of motor neuron-related-splicing factor 30